MFLYIRTQYDSYTITFVIIHIESKNKYNIGQASFMQVKTKRKRILLIKEISFENMSYSQYVLIFKRANIILKNVTN